MEEFKLEKEDIEEEEKPLIIIGKLDKRDIIKKEDGTIMEVTSKHNAKFQVIGNSLYVSIPKSIANSLNIGKGELATITQKQIVTLYDNGEKPLLIVPKYYFKVSKNEDYVRNTQFLIEDINTEDSESREILKDFIKRTEKLANKISELSEEINDQTINSDIALPLYLKLMVLYEKFYNQFDGKIIHPDYNTKEIRTALKNMMHFLMVKGNPKKLMEILNLKHKI